MRYFFTIFVFLLSFVHTSAYAAVGPWVETDFAKARLISSADNWPAADEDRIWRAALEVQLKAGWKIYWRSPGDAGLPTQVFLDEPTRNAGYLAELKFPVPERFTLFGLETYGYGGRVILPLDVTVPSGNPAFISGMLDLLACSDICVPMQGALSLDLQGGTGAPSIYAQEIAFALAHVPSAATGPNIDVTEIWVDAASNNLLVRYETGFPLTDIFVEGAGAGYSFARPATDGGVARIQVAGKPVSELVDKTLQFTIVAGEEVAEVQLPVLLQSDASEQDISTLIFSILGIAFLGGLILNVMPCVLPVLSLKIISVLSMREHTHLRIRQRFLASAAGVVSSFGLLAAGLVLLRFAGLQIGWGIQFQQPVFLAIIFVVLALFTLSLLDKIAIPIPAFLSNLSRSDKPHSLSSDFMSGMLATLLATPCSAPFVGTAITFALTGSDLILVLIMLFMGLGLASPWLILAVQPKLVFLLPKPGYWMVWLKYALGILLLGTTIWVAWLFAGSVGLRSERVMKSEIWQAWSVEEMESQLKDGKLVLVDVTADWCITCKTNKLLVLDADAAIAATEALNVVRLQADWTRPNQEISAFLARYGRYGIPFNVILHENLDKPVILPAVLTLKALTNSLQSASASAGF